MADVLAAFSGTLRRHDLGASFRRLARASPLTDGALSASHALRTSGALIALSAREAAGAGLRGYTRGAASLAERLSPLPPVRLPACDPVQPEPLDRDELLAELVALIAAIDAQSEGAARNGLDADSADAEALRVLGTAVVPVGRAYGPSRVRHALAARGSALYAGLRRVPLVGDVVELAPVAYTMACDLIGRDTQAAVAAARAHFDRDFDLHQLQDSAAAIIGELMDAFFAGDVETVAGLTAEVPRRLLLDAMRQRLNARIEVTGWTYWAGEPALRSADVSEEGVPSFEFAVTLSQLYAATRAGEHGPELLHGSLRRGTDFEYVFKLRPAGEPRAIVGRGNDGPTRWIVSALLAPTLDATLEPRGAT
jgi:hypothetical protein